MWANLWENIEKISTKLKMIITFFVNLQRIEKTLSKTF